MSTSNSLNKNEDGIGSKTAKFLRSLLKRSGEEAPTPPATEPTKEESQQPPKAEVVQEEPKVEEKKDDDKPIYGRSTRPFIPSPLGND